MQTDEHFMQHALKLAEYAEHNGEVPVGAVLVKDNIIIAEGWNQPISTHDPSAHAEMIALRKAGYTLSNYRLPDTTLYVTLEPCVMCVGAMIHARIKRLVYAASEPRTGAVTSVFELLDDDLHNHNIEVTSGVLADESSELLKSFFKHRRANRNKADNNSCC